MGKLKKTSKRGKGKGKKRSEKNQNAPENSADQDVEMASTSNIGIANAGGIPMKKKKLKRRKSTNAQLSEKTESPLTETGVTIDVNADGNADDMLIDTVNQALAATRKSNRLNDTVNQTLAVTRKSHRKTADTKDGNSGTGSKKTDRFEKMKSRRRDMHDSQRVLCDARIRSEPHLFLWEWYVSMAGDRLTAVEKSQDLWTPEHIHVIQYSSASDTIIPAIKRTLGDDYPTPSSLEKAKSKAKKATPSITCIGLGNGAIRTVALAKRLYDGAPVSKLLAREKIDKQREQLRLLAAKRGGLLRTASSTARRLHRLVDEGGLSLSNTRALVIDMGRDTLLRNMLDMDHVSTELFDLLHNVVRPLITTGSLRVFLLIPEEDVMPTQRVVNNNPDKTETTQEVADMEE